MHYIKCPICQSDMNYDGDQEENYEYCTNKCYAEEFHYGYTRVSIFGKEFFANYRFSADEEKKFRKNIEREIKHLRKNEKYLIKIMESNND
ncbi:hypothetical protein D3C87_76700 [compost metagenome]